jgi:transposase-like protein
MNVELTNELSIPERIKHHKKKINKHESAILQIQEECSHKPPYLSVEYESDSGNWCKQDDFSFTRFKCSSCEKTWITDGHKSLESYYSENKINQRGVHVE